MSEEQLVQKPEDQWAIVELMGHAQTAGRVTRPSEWGGLLRVDVPDGESNGFRTEFYGISAIYALRFVSEEIARARAIVLDTVRNRTNPDLEMLLEKEGLEAVVRMAYEHALLDLMEVQLLDNDGEGAERAGAGIKEILWAMCSRILNRINAIGKEQ